MTRRLKYAGMIRSKDDEPPADAVKLVTVYSRYFAEPDRHVELGVMMPDEVYERLTDKIIDDIIGAVTQALARRRSS
jgi:hypothetical protein